MHYTTKPVAEIIEIRTQTQVKTEKYTKTMLIELHPLQPSQQSIVNTMSLAVAVQHKAVKSVLVP
jgi:hypothetical protein